MFKKIQVLFFYCFVCIFTPVNKGSLTHRCMDTENSLGLGVSDRPSDHTASCWLPCRDRDRAVTSQLIHLMPTLRSKWMVRSGRREHRKLHAWPIEERGGILEGQKTRGKIRKSYALIWIGSFRGKILYILRRSQLSSTILGKTHHEARTSILRRLPVHPSQDHQLWAPVPVYTEEVVSVQCHSTNELSTWRNPTGISTQPSSRSPQAEKNGMI